jgi:hypothetical protein
MIQPNDTRWNNARDFRSGTWMPFNRRALVRRAHPALTESWPGRRYPQMFHGLAKLATVHSLAPVLDQVRVDRYNNLLDVNVRDFVYALHPTKSRGYDT